MLLLWSLLQPRAALPTLWPVSPNWLLRASPRRFLLTPKPRIFILKARAMPLVGSFPSIESTERIPLTIDFATQLPLGDSLTGTPVATLTAHNSVDPDASALLWGSPAIVGTQVVQWAGPNWVAGVTYELKITATSARGQVITLHALITAQA